MSEKTENPKSSPPEELDMARWGEAPFRVLVEVSPCLVLVIREDRCDYINPAGARLLGYDQTGDVIGQPVADLVAPGSQPTLTEMMQEVAGDRSGGMCDIEFLTKCGEGVLLETFPAVVSWKGESVIVLIARDITQQRHTEEALCRAEYEKTLILDTTSEVFTVYDKDFRIAWVNRAGYESVNLTRAQIIGQRCYQIWHQSDRPCPECPVQKAVKTKKQEEGEITSPDGRIWFLRSHPVLDEAGDVVGAIEFAQDITRRKKDERAILRYQQQLQSMASELALVEERERHHLAMDLHDHIGQMLILSKMKLESLQTISDAEHRRREIAQLDNLLSRAIQETQTLTFELASPTLYELGLEAALQELLEQKFPAVDTQRAEFHDDGLDKSLAEDVKVTLYRMVRELLTNVLRHARADCISLAVRRDDNRIKISVEDNGIGFNLSEVAHKPDINGGYGLFSIRERLKHIGGRLLIDAQPGRGARFTLLAPLAREPQSATP